MQDREQSDNVAARGENPNEAQGIAPIAECARDEVEQRRVRGDREQSLVAHVRAEDGDVGVDSHQRGQGSRGDESEERQVDRCLTDKRPVFAHPLINPQASKDQDQEPRQQQLRQHERVECVPEEDQRE